jgi:hypothetical protein
MILNCKTMPKEQLPGGIIARCQPKGWMASELMKDWLLVLWNRRPGVHRREWGRLVLDAFKRHLRPEIKVAITGSSMNTHLVVIPGEMASQLHVLDVMVNELFRDHLKQLFGKVHRM